MFKSILKSTLALTLAMGTTISFLIGLNLYGFNNPKDLKKEKRDLINNYKLSQEGNEIKENIQEDYLSKLQSGEINNAEYAKKVDELEKTSVTEELIVNYGGEEINADLNRLNKAIDEMNDKRLAGIIMSSTSCALCLPIAISSLKMLSSSGLKLVKREENEYSNTMVII